MATKKKPSIPDAIAKFKEVSQRAAFLNYVYVNDVLQTSNIKGQNVFIIIDQLLWDPLTNDEEIKSKLQPLSMDGKEKMDLILKHSKMLFTNDDQWVQINDCEGFIKGTNMIKVNVPNMEYDLTINKNLIPIKLRKAEANNISYKIFNSVNPIIVVKKYFEYKIDDQDYGFAIARAFKVV